MYAFSEDETHLLFMDCFGLTRLSRPSQLETDTKIMGSESAGLVSVAADASAAASYEDLWDKVVLWTFPKLRSAKRFDRFRERGTMIHPEGTHYLVPESGGVAVRPLTKAVLLPLRLDKPQPRNKPKEIRFGFEGGEQLPDLQIDGGVGRPSVLAPLRLAHDGTLLWFDGPVLVRGQLSGTKLSVEWRRRITTPESARLELYADAERSVVMLHRGLRWIVVERVGERERMFEIESLAVPAIAGRHLVYQPSLDRVIRRDLVSDEQHEFSLSLPAAKRKLELDPAGVGTIFAGAEGSLLVLVAHRESLIDLIAGVEIPRKLPAKQLAIRQAVLALARPYVDAARQVGAVIELGRVDLDAKRKSVSVTHRIFGADDLVGALLAGHSQSTWQDVALPEGWRMSGYGSHGGISCKANLTRDDLVVAYTKLAATGVAFASTIGFWANQLDNDPPDAGAIALLGQALVATVREGAAAPLDFAALAERGVPAIDDVLAAFAHYPRRVDELDYTTSRLAGRVFNQLHGADAARLWRDLFLESNAWTNYGTHYCDLDHHAIQPLIEDHPETAELFSAWIREHPDIDQDRRYYVDQLRDRLQPSEAD